MMAEPRLDPGKGARASDEWIESVRAASDIVEIIGQSVTLKRVGRNWVGLCPFHGEKTPSFAVNPERQFYHCFSCKAGGDVFKFIQETEKLGFLEAAELLSRRAGIPVPERRAALRGSRGPLHQALEEAARLYEQWLADPERGARARSYLEARGLGREATKNFRLGLAPAGWENLVGRLGARFGDEVLVAAGLAARREGGRGLYDRFRDRLMVPLVASGGQVVGFGARALAPGSEPKYLNSPETAVYHKGSFLYALDRARRAVGPEDELVVVEGYFDAIALHQAGVANAVATSGTALTPDQVGLLRRVVSRVSLTYDGDQAGQEAMMRSLGTLLAGGLEVVVVDLPAGEDPDALLRREGIEGWKRVRAAAADPIEFIQRHRLRAGGPGDPRAEALAAVVELAAAVGDPIRLRLMLERAAQVFGLAESVLGRAVALRRAGQRSERPIEAAVHQQARGERHLERELLQALLHDPGWLEEARRRLEPGDFRDPACAALAEWMWSGEAGTPTEPVAALLRELTTAGEESRWDAVAEGGVRRLLRRRLEGRYKVAQRRILELQQRGLAADAETLQLLQESQDLARSISDLNR